MTNERNMEKYSKYCCPKCKGDLSHIDKLTCNKCDFQFQMYDSVPRLISPENPIFGSADLSKMESSGFRKPLLQRIGGWIPSPSLDLGRKKWEPKLLQITADSRGLCLIIGAGDDNNLVMQMRELFDYVIVSDVVLGPSVQIICDGTELPIRNSTVDCVIAIAVLEHVLQPELVVAEINRVLKEGGVVVADTPFMQPVHMRQYDFTRFTDLGYRWLFRRFEEVDRGVSVGPASGLVWSIMYFFRSFGWSRISSLIFSTLARLTFFWLKYIDLIIAHRSASRDGAAGLYFVGRKRSVDTVDPKKLIDDYRGF